MSKVNLTLAQQLLLEDLIERAIEEDVIIRPMAGTRECVPGQVISRLLKLYAGMKAQRHSKYAELEPRNRSGFLDTEEFKEANANPKFKIERTRFRPTVAGLFLDTLTPDKEKPK